MSYEQSNIAFSRRPSLPSPLDVVTPLSLAAAASLAMSRKLSLDETGRSGPAAATSAAAATPTDGTSHEETTAAAQQEHQYFSAMPLPSTFALPPQQKLNLGDTPFKSMLFSRMPLDGHDADGMDWDAADAGRSALIGGESMISSSSAASFASSNTNSHAGPPSTVNTSLSSHDLSQPLGSRGDKSEFSSASSVASSAHTEEMDDDLPPPLSRSCGSIKSLELQTPAKERGNDEDKGMFHSNYSMNATVKSPNAMTRSSSSQEATRTQRANSASSSSSSSNQLGTSPRNLGPLGQSLGLMMADSPMQQLQRPASMQLSRSKRFSLALSPLKITPGSAFSRPNQPTTPGGSVIPYARDGAATGEVRSPFEPPTPLKAIHGDSFPFTTDKALRASGSLSPMSADFAAALTLSHSKLRDDSSSRSPSPAGSRRASLMDARTASPNARPKLVKSKSSMGKPYTSSYAIPPLASSHRTVSGSQQRESSPGVSSSSTSIPRSSSVSSATQILFQDDGSYPSAPPTPAGFVKPVITATPPQALEELPPMEPLPGIPEPDMTAASKPRPIPTPVSRPVGKPVQMQATAPPMDRSMSAPVFQTVSARHLAHRQLHPGFESKYTLGHELGSGGFGFVVSATRNVDHRPVAVKFIWKEKVPSHGWVRDPHLGVVPMEAFALKVIDHPNVVKFIELFDDDDFFYLVMEMHGSPWKAPDPKEDKLAAKKADQPSKSGNSLDSSLSPPTRPVPMERRSSCDLFECIEQHSRLTEEQARWVFAQVVEAVWYLDSLGISHRDIKDENCVVDADFTVKLIDFGSAVLSDPRKPPPYFNRFFGTMTFASSEILQGKQYRAPHAEVWSLGVLLSILISGQCPFADPGAAIKGQISKPKGMWTKESLALMMRCLDVNADTRATIHEIRNHPWVSHAWQVKGRVRPHPL